MQNFDLLENKMLQLVSGVFTGVESYGCYPGGELEGIKLSAKNTLITQAGELVPAYTETHRRKNKYSVEFYQNGAIKAVALNEVQEIQTPLGKFSAELVTFFETGELKRFFPLDGQISGLWTEQEEKALALPLSFRLPFTVFTAIVGGIAFYQDGDIRSITLFPGETVAVAAKYGVLPVRNGFSLYESGELESLEPAAPVVIQTPLGALTAFDPNAVGVNADVNSLVLDRSGKIIALITAQNRITAQTAAGRLLTFSPREVVNPLDDETMITEGLKITFDYGADTVTFADGAASTVLPLSGGGFTVSVYSGSSMCSPKNCAGCALGCGDNSQSSAH